MDAISKLKEDWKRVDRALIPEKLLPFAQRGFVDAPKQPQDPPQAAPLRRNADRAGEIQEHRVAILSREHVAPVTQVEVHDAASVAPPYRRPQFGNEGLRNATAKRAREQFTRAILQHEGPPV